MRDEMYGISLINRCACCDIVITEDLYCPDCYDHVWMVGYRCYWAEPWNERCCPDGWMADPCPVQRDREDCRPYSWEAA